MKLNINLVVFTQVVVEKVGWVMVERWVLNSGAEMHTFPLVHRVNFINWVHTHTVCTADNVCDHWNEQTVIRVYTHNVIVYSLIILLVTVMHSLNLVPVEMLCASSLSLLLLLSWACSYCCCMPLAEGQAAEDSLLDKFLFAHLCKVSWVWPFLYSASSLKQEYILVVCV